LDGSLWPPETAWRHKAGEWGTIVIDTGTQFCDWVAKEIFYKASPKKLEKQSMLV
jgi:hypothetical protein